MKAIKGILIFLVGFGTGTVSTYFFMKNKTNKEIETRVTKAVENNSKKTTDTPKITPEQSNSQPIEEDNAIKKSNGPEKRPDLSDYTKAIKEANYDSAVNNDKITTMSDAVEEKTERIIDQAIKKTATKKTKVPKKITQDEFDATSEEERATLYYYADGILADDEDKQYDPVETLGATNFKNFKSTYDTIYIFNYALNMMFEVMPSNSKYADAVGGDFHH